RGKDEPDLAPGISHADVVSVCACGGPQSLLENRRHIIRIPAQPMEIAMDEPLTAEVFVPHTGKVFRVKDGRHELTLSSVDLCPVEGWDPKIVPHRPFTLIFSGPPRDVLQQGMYTFEVAG